MQGCLLVHLYRGGRCLPVPGGWEGAPAWQSHGLLPPATGLILFRLCKLGNSLKHQSVTLQCQAAALHFFKQKYSWGLDHQLLSTKMLKQVHKLQNKILKTAGNYGRDLWSPPSTRSSSKAVNGSHCF